MSESRTIPIVGAHFRPPAKALLASVPSGLPLYLRPEPTNDYDPNAVQVFLRTADIHDPAHWAEIEVHAAGQGYDLDAIRGQTEWHLGYIPRAAKGDPAQEADNIAAQRAIIDAFDSTEPSDIVGALTFTGDGKPAIIVSPWPPIGEANEEDEVKIEDEEENFCEDCGELLEDCTCKEEKETT